MIRSTPEVSNHHGLSAKLATTGLLRCWTTASGRLSGSVA